jgi:hypothetical protein
VPLTPSHIDFPVNHPDAARDLYWASLGVVKSEARSGSMLISAAIRWSLIWSRPAGKLFAKLPVLAK